MECSLISYFKKPWASIAILFCVLLPSIGNSACSSPTASAGAMEYFVATSEMKYCNGTSWITTKYGGVTPITSLVDTAAGRITANDVAVAGNYAYMVGSNAAGLFYLTAINITNLSTPTFAGDYVGSAGAGQSIASDGTYLYAVQGTTLLVFSLASPTSPTLLGSVTNASISSGRMVVAGNYVYLASGKLVIIDVTTKSSPAVASTLTNSNFTSGSGITVSGNYVYIAGASTGYLVIVDISNKSSPAAVGSVKEPSVSMPRGVAVYGNYAYVTSASGSSNPLAIIDISNKSSPTAFGTTTVVQYSNDILIKANYAYVTDGNGNLNTLDLSSPTSPQLQQRASTLSFSYPLSKISFDGTKLVGLSTGTGLFATFDIGPTSMPLLPEAAQVLSGSPLSIDNTYAAGNTAVLANSDGSLWTFDITNPAAMTPLSQQQIKVSSNLYFPGGDFDGTYFYFVGPNQSSLYVFDLSNPASPFLTKTINHSNLSQVMAVRRSGNYIYAASANGFSIIDATTMATASMIGFNNTPLSWAKKVVISGNYAYVIQANVLSIFDITTKTAPTLIGTLTDSTNLNAVTDIAVSGNYAFIVGSSFMTVVDITTKSSPTYATKLAGLSTSANIKISGNYAYVSGSSLRSIDISTPTAPVLKNSLVCNCLGVEVLGTTAFSGNTTLPGINSFNLSNPLSLSAISSAAFNGIYESVRRFAFQGNYVLSASATSKTVTVTDISTPTNPTVSKVITDTTRYTGINDLVVSGNYAYTASSGYFTVIDVTTPATASIIGTITDATKLASGKNVRVSGNYAYYLGSSRFTVVDITTKSAPVILASITNALLSGCEGLDISGNYAYAVCATSIALVVIDVTTPSSPTIVGNSSLGASTSSKLVNVIGNYAFVADSKIKVIDVTNKAAPFLATSFDGVYSCSGCIPTDMFSVGNNLYSSGGSAIVIWDVSNPFSPEALGAPIMNSIFRTPNRMGLSSNRLVTVDGFDTLFVHEVLGIPGPMKASSKTTFAPRLKGANGIALSGNKAFIINGNSAQLTVLDISSPETPTLFSSWADPLFIGANSITISGNYAYIGETQTYGLSVIDISNPSSPFFVKKILSSFTNFFGIQSMKAVGNYLYVVGASSGKFSTVNISSPSAPAIAGSISGTTGGLAISGTYAFTCNGAALTIVDISNPASLTSSSFSNAALSGCKSIATLGNYAYVLSTGNKSMVVLDISTPTSPTIVGSVIDTTKLLNPSDIEVQGNYAYVTLSTGSITLIDISNPAAPAINDAYATSGFVNNGRLLYPYVFTADSTNSAVKVYKALPLITQGACSPAGKVDYITATNVFAYCNGSVFIPMGPIPGAGGAGCSTPTAKAGSFNYNSGINKMTYCDGSTWVSIQ
ncbi:LVIVD repeat-containing protein [Bdellovibrio svalbardensis]|uniref:LVIVD repeat protein n=1 Tax=Bdellovibrio svalbardensis TaxID=2972972 RepID=A0ABT6DKW9_9BACT|nr:hypothetical protein [Bdellovibrio svalbardensis]MDG0817500.1 hypothetical protein [Bdellovibrio svalbardensis]